MAVERLLSDYKDQLGDDDQVVADSIEGETRFYEIVDVVLNRLAELEDHIEAITIQGRKLNSRNSRYKSQHEGLRQALLRAMELTGLRRIERASATVSRRFTAGTATILKEQDLPDQFLVKQPSKPDLRALTAALKDGPVPGATLSEPKHTISITRS